MPRNPQPIGRLLAFLLVAALIGFTSLPQRMRQDSGSKGAASFGAAQTIAKLAIVWAQSDPSLGARGVRGFLIPLPQAGLEVRPIERKLSLRISYSGELFLRDVELPAEALLPGATSLGAALSCLNQAQIEIFCAVVSLWCDTGQVVVIAVRAAGEIAPAPQGGVGENPELRNAHRT